MSLPFDPSQMNKETFHSEKGLKVELINSLPDSMRQFEEKQAMSAGRQTDFITNEVTNKIIAFLKTLKTDKVDVVTIGKNLLKNESNSFDGSIDYTFRVLHSGLTKDIHFKVIMKNNSFDLPNANIITAELDNAVSHEEVKNNELKTEMNTTVKAIEAAQTAPITKTAVRSTPIIHPVIHVQKTWLPSSLKLGDVLNLEGAKYVIVADDHNKMSANSDGVFWTLRQVTESVDSGTPEISIA